jgi:hypothetical protein
MSFRNRTGLLGLLVGASVAIASACGGLSDVKIVITDDVGGSGGHPGGGDGSSGKGDGGKPSGGEHSADSGAGGVSDVGGAAGAGGEAMGGEGGQFVVPDPMPGPPTVTSVSPRDQANDADPRGAIRIYFSEPLDPATVTGASIQIKDAAGNVIEGPVNYADAVATFVPKVRMNLLGSYTVNVSTAITDAGKAPMERPFTSTFSVRDGVWGRVEGLLSAGKGGFDRNSIPVLASDGGTRAVAVWAQATDTGTNVELFASQYNAGKGWTTPFKVNTNPVRCESPSVSMNASGNVIVGWVEYDAAVTPQSYSVQTRRFIAGTWDATSTRIDIPSTAAYRIEHQSVTVALATNGHAHVAWSSFDNNTTTTPSVNEYGVMARHADAAGTWDTAVTNLSYIQPASGVSAPALSFDADSNGFAAYQLTTGTPAKTNTLMFRYTTKWGSSAVASGSGDGYAMPVAVATNAAGDAVASWARATAVDANNTAYDVMASSYSKAWNAPVVVSTAKTALANPTKITMAAATWTGASFLVAWSQSGGATSHIYATEYKGTAWGTTTIVSDGNHSSGIPWLTGDGRGNALAVWYQASDSPASSSTSYLDIVFSRFVGTASKWSDYGRASSAVAAYVYPQAVTLADGTVLASWQRQINNIIIKSMNVNGVFQNDFQ